MASVVKVDLNWMKDTALISETRVSSATCDSEREAEIDENAEESEGEEDQ
jgi:hypothetical protein